MKAFENFNELTLPPALIDCLDRMGFKTPTPVQAAGIPSALLGKDILGIAPTGTGKTGAYGIPAIANLYPHPGKQILILAPTRELAAQIFRFMRQMGEKLKLKGTLLVGGESFGRQRAEYKRGVDFFVATPGRLMDHLGQGLRLTSVNLLVLDEVDRMLDMGFAPQVEEIVRFLPKTRQTFLFSATLPREIKDLANRYLRDPISIKVEGTSSHTPKISEEQIHTTEVEKPRLLMDQVKTREGKILIFVNTQGHAEQVARNLENAGHPAACMHGGRTHGERKRALEAFRQGRVRLLVATDIAARGIDVPDIEHVFNFDRPANEEDYLHRIGRTGRIGKSGCAVNFIVERSRGRRPHSHTPPFQGSIPKPLSPKLSVRPSSGRASSARHSSGRPSLSSRHSSGRPSLSARHSSARPSLSARHSPARPSSTPRRDFRPEPLTRPNKHRSNVFTHGSERVERTPFSSGFIRPKPAAKRPFIRGTKSSVRRPKGSNIHS